MKYRELPRDEQGDILAEEIRFPVEVPLLKPVKADEGTRSVLQVEEPLVRDIEIANREKTRVGAGIVLIALVSDLTPEQARGMGSRDFKRLSELVGSFFVTMPELRAAMADLATIWHWPLSELRALRVSELRAWRREAIVRWKIITRRAR